VLLFEEILRFQVMIRLIKFPSAISNILSKLEMILFVKVLVILTLNNLPTLSSSVTFYIVYLQILVTLQILILTLILDTLHTYQPSLITELGIFTAASPVVPCFFRTYTHGEYAIVLQISSYHVWSQVYEQFSAYVALNQLRSAFTDAFN
jgi:hypothetical protein